MHPVRKQQLLQQQRPQHQQQNKRQEGHWPPLRASQTTREQPKARPLILCFCCFLPYLPYVRQVPLEYAGCHPRKGSPGLSSSPTPVLLLLGPESREKEQQLLLRVQQQRQTVTVQQRK